MLPALEIPGKDETPTFRLSPKGVSAYELWQVQKKRRELRQEYLDHWLGTEKVTGTGRPVDAIICPVAPYVAPPHGMNRCVFVLMAITCVNFWTGDFRTADYTIVWNGLDYSSLVIPVSKVDQALDVRQPRDKFYSDADKANYERCTPKIMLSQIHVEICPCRRSYHIQKCSYFYSACREDPGRGGSDCDERNCR